MIRRNSILLPGIAYSIVLITLLVFLFFSRDAGELTLILLKAGAIIVLVVAAIHFITGVYLPLLHMVRQVSHLTEGEPLQKPVGRTGDEFMRLEEALGEHADRLDEVVRIISNLSEGNFEANIPIEGSHDELGKSLVQLRQSIMQLNIESQKRRKLDEQQNWASKGLAMFGELVRDADPDPSQFSSLFTRELTRYMDVEMGALFLLEYNDAGKPFYALKGAHAYDHENQFKKTFEPGEGLVGRCAAGKEALVITDLPGDYIRIRSGMGEGSPATIILVPVIFDTEVLGVIELATFSIVKQYKVEFLKRLGNSTGSAISRMISRP